jgi:hypothetical protein
MDLGRLFRFLDVYDPIYMINGDYFAEPFISEKHVLPGPNIAPLRVKQVTVGWYLPPSLDSLHKAQARQPHSLIQQLFIIHFRKSVAFLPRPLVLSTVPTQKLRQKPLTRLLLGPRLRIYWNSFTKPLCQ